MKLVFVELPPFARHRAGNMDDGQFRSLQQLLLLNPGAGSLISGTGGLRKLRLSHPGRGKGKRGGLRIIYYWWKKGRQVWLFTIYAIGEVEDLTNAERKSFCILLQSELKLRQEKP